MLDKNGKEIRVGAKAVLVGAKVHDELDGRIGEVRAIKENWGVTKRIRPNGEPRVRVSEGPEGDWEWSVWAKPETIVVVG